MGKVNIDPQVPTYQWIESEVPKDLEVRQVYGFIFDLDGRVLVFEDEEQFNLPGGKPEKDESLSQTLIREVLEEVQVTLISIDYLGYQLISAGERYAQVRMVGIVENVFPATPDPSNGRKYSRIWVPPVQLNDLLKWGDSGSSQIASAVTMALKLGIFWNGTPQTNVQNQTYPDGGRGV